MMVDEGVVSLIVIWENDMGEEGETTVGKDKEWTKC